MFDPRRRMNIGLQEHNIGQMISNSIREREMVDVRSMMDSTLSYRENRDNISKQLGINQRNRGMEEFQQRGQERQREQQRRADDPFRQTGRIQNAHNLELDRMQQAMSPGKRFSADGHRYYERRANRSDKGKLL